MIRNALIIAVVAVSVIAATRFFRTNGEEETQQMYQLLTVESRDVSHDKIVDEIVSALARRLESEQGAASASGNGDHAA